MTMPPLTRVCVQWPRFGPYHLARLRAAHAYFQERGVELIGLETAARDLYDWREETSDTPFRREQVFLGQTFEDIHSDAMYEGMLLALDRLNPDAVAIHTYSFPDSRACLTWCRRNRRPAILMTDTKEDDVPRVGWREWVKSKIVNLYDAALLAGTPQKAYFTKLGFPNEHIFLGYDVVDNAYFRTGAEAARQNPDAHRSLPGLDGTPFFLASNRFIARKNLDGLLRAYHQYRIHTSTPWNLVMLGDGADRANLEALVAKENIEGVIFAGFRQIDEIPVYYGLAQAFIHPAHADQWALVVNEAMAAGLPIVVSTKAGCAYDLVKEGKNGFRFDPTDLERLTACLTQLSDPQTDIAAMGQYSAQLIATWSPERFAASLWDAIQAGQTRADRPFAPVAQGLLWAIKQASSSVHAFHSVEA